MKYITSQANRTLTTSTTSTTGAEWLEIQTREQYLPPGYQRHKWVTDSIVVTRAELKAIAETHGFEVIDKGGPHA